MTVGVGPVYSWAPCAAGARERLGPVCSWGPCEASEQSNALNNCYFIHICGSALSGLRMFYLGHSNLPRLL